MGFFMICCFFCWGLTWVGSGASNRFQEEVREMTLETVFQIAVLLLIVLPGIIVFSAMLWSTAFGACKMCYEEIRDAVRTWGG